MDSFRAAVKARLKAEEEKKGAEGESDMKYRVQVGIFSSKSRAETMVKKLKSAGFDGYIKQE
jgi:cell division septation protein DedD